MEIFNGIDIAQAGFVSLATFGSVSVLNFWGKLDSKTNFLWSVVFAIIYSFVPANLGNELANRFRDAVYIAVALNGAYQFSGGVMKKMTNQPLDK